MVFGSIVSSAVRARSATRWAEADEALGWRRDQLHKGMKASVLVRDLHEGGKLLGYTSRHKKI